MKREDSGEEPASTGLQHFSADRSFLPSEMQNAQHVTQHKLARPFVRFNVRRIQSASVAVWLHLCPVLSHYMTSLYATDWVRSWGLSGGALRSPLFWDMTACHRVIDFRRFEVTYSRHLQGSESRGSGNYTWLVAGRRVSYRRRSFCLYQWLRYPVGGYPRLDNQLLLMDSSKCTSRCHNRDLVRGSSWNSQQWNSPVRRRTCFNILLVWDPS
jgi:hypothetical protein